MIKKLAEAWLSVQCVQKFLWKESSGFLSYKWMDPKALWAPDSPQVWIWYDVWHGTVALRYTLVTVGQSQTLKIVFPEYQY